MFNYVRYPELRALTGPLCRIRVAVADGPKRPGQRKLLRYINLPSQWTSRSGSGFDTFLIEGYQYPGINHNLDQATQCAQYPWRQLAWDQAHCRYLMGLYYATWPWLREFVNVNRLGLPVIKLWAYDHLCLFAWPIPLPHKRRPLLHLLNGYPFRLAGGWSVRRFL